MPGEQSQLPGFLAAGRLGGGVQEGRPPGGEPPGRGEGAGHRGEGAAGALLQPQVLQGEDVGEVADVDRLAVLQAVQRGVERAGRVQGGGRFVVEVEHGHGVGPHRGGQGDRAGRLAHVGPGDLLAAPVDQADPRDQGGRLGDGEGVAVAQVEGDAALDGEEEEGDLAAEQPVEDGAGVVVAEVHLGRDRERVDQQLERALELELPGDDQRGGPQPDQQQRRGVQPDPLGAPADLDADAQADAEAVEVQLVDPAQVEQVVLLDHQVGEHLGDVAEAAGGQGGAGRRAQPRGAATAGVDAVLADADEGRPDLGLAREHRPREEGAGRDVQGQELAHLEVDLDADQVGERVDQGQPGHGAGQVVGLGLAALLEEGGVDPEDHPGPGELQHQPALGVEGAGRVGQGADHRPHPEGPGLALGEEGAADAPQDLAQPGQLGGDPVGGQAVDVAGHVGPEQPEEAVDPQPRRAQRQPGRVLHLQGEAGGGEVGLGEQVQPPRRLDPGGDDVQVEGGLDLAAVQHLQLALADHHVVDVHPDLEAAQLGRRAVLAEADPQGGLADLDHAQVEQERHVELEEQAAVADAGGGDAEQLAQRAVQVEGTRVHDVDAAALGGVEQQVEVVEADVAGRLDLPEVPETPARPRGTGRSSC